MQRVLTLATCGLFATGLAVLPMVARADQAVTGATTPAPTASMTAPAKMSGEHASTATVKKDDKKVTTAPATGGSVTPGAAGTTATPSTTTTTAPVKTPGKGAS